MYDVQFRIDSAAIAKRAITPTLLFDLRIESLSPPVHIDSISLHCQIRIEAVRRRYNAIECENLRDLFGERGRWTESLRGFVWTHVNASIPHFDSRTQFELPVACTYDFNIAATKYFNGICDGDVPLTFLFSGSVFHRDRENDLQIEPVNWTHDAPYRLPIALWRAMMERYYPDGAWVPLARSTLHKLERIRRENRLSDCGQAIELLMREVPEPVS